MEAKDRTLLISALYSIYLIHVYASPAESWEWTFYSQITSWNDGTRFCEASGGRIVNINSQAKKNILLDFKNQQIGSQWGPPVWMGVYYDSQQQTRYWQGLCNDEDSNGYNNWESSDRPGSSKPCVMMDGGSMRWKPEVCKQEYIVICERPTDSSTACSNYVNNDNSGNQICVKGVVDPSTSLPTAFLSQEDVDNPPCFDSFNSAANPSTNGPTTSQETTSKEQTTQQDASTKDTSTILSSKDAHITSVTSPETTDDTTMSITNKVSTNNEYTAVTVSTISETEGSTQASIWTDNSSQSLSSTTMLNRPICDCTCFVSVNMTQEQLLQKLEELRSILSIAKKETLKSKLKLISVKDDRTSSKAIGSLGTLIVALVVVLVVLIDSVNLIRFLQNSKKKEKNA